MEAGVQTLCLPGIVCLCLTLTLSHMGLLKFRVSRSLLQQAAEVTFTMIYKILGIKKNALMTSDRLTEHNHFSWKN